jgi:PAS domain S-box-containing protein
MSHDGRTGTGGDSRKPVILVVDDDANNLAVVRDCLLECDYTILVAEDGESAIARADYAKPDLILLDVMMPGIDGFETCRRLKALPGTREIAVIFMTALAETGHKVKGLEVGGVDYITKPFQREELLARIAVHLQIRELTRMLLIANETLENRVAQRTEDLAIANCELEQEIAERQVAQEQLQEQAVILEEKIEELQRTQNALLKSEQKFRAIFDQTFELMGLLTPEGILIEANRTALDFCGIEEAQVIGKPYWEGPWWSWSPELQEKVRRAVADAAAGELVRFETRYRNARGETYYIDFSLKPLMDDQGRVTMLIPEGRDISERKAAETEHLRLATAVEQIAEAILITDTDFQVQYVNPAFERMNGYSKAEIIGRSTNVIRSDDFDQGVYQGILETLIGGQVWAGRLTNKRKDGSCYQAEVMASPIQNAEGTVINYVSIHRDITHEMKLEQELRQAQKMEAIGTLAAGIAHDFNNILTAIIGNTEMALAKIAPGDPVRRNIERVVESGSRAAELVKQILTFSRQAEQERKPVQLASITTEVLKLLRSSLPTTIEIRQNIDLAPEQSVVFADATQLHQVLMNLCTNAAHAMRARGGRLIVDLEETVADASLVARYPNLQPGRHLKLTVSDTGHGIDAAVMDRIFDPYFTTKKAGEGTGMGLAVTMGIVQSYGGAITVYSEPGHGTTFQVLLPKADMEMLQAAGGTDTIPTGHERVLFVDDEKLLVDMAQEMLDVLGYQVTAVTSSMEVLERFRAHPFAFDLVITDMTMPGLTGRELSKELLAIRPDIPIIMCSGFTEFVNAEVARESGIREFLMKPYATDSLAKTVRKALEPVG